MAREESASNSDRPQYQSGVGTINGTTFHWGSGTPGRYWSIPYGDYPVTPDAPTGAWAHQVGAIPIANNIIPDPVLNRNRVGIMIHPSSSNHLDQLYTQGCFAVAPQEWPAVKQQILEEASKGPLYLHVQPGQAAAFTHEKTLSQAGAPPASESPPGTTINASNAPVAGALAKPAGPDFYATAMEHESGGRNIPNSAGGWNAAGGYFQFTPPTWATIRSARPDLNLPENVKDANQDQQTAAYKHFVSQNVTALQAAGLPVTDKNAFMASFLGAGGATKFLTAMKDNPNANAAELFPKEAAANPTVFYSGGKPRSLSDVFALQTGKFGTGNTTGFGPDATPASTGTAVASTAPAAPAAAPAQQPWYASLTKKPDSGGKSPMEAAVAAFTQGPERMKQAEADQAPQQVKNEAGPAPPARNVSPGLQNIQQTYGQTLNSFMQPLTWTSAPPGRPQMPAAGLQTAAAPSVPGISLNSFQPSLQGLGYGIPAVGYGYG